MACASCSGRRIRGRRRGGDKHRTTTPGDEGGELFVARVVEPVVDHDEHSAREILRRDSRVAFEVAHLLRQIFEVGY
jgi:hypothetical protein